MIEVDGRFFYPANEDALAMLPDRIRTPSNCMGSRFLPFEVFKNRLAERVLNWVCRIVKVYRHL